jgi:hypothetical protein
MLFVPRIPACLPCAVAHSLEKAWPPHSNGHDALLEADTVRLISPPGTCSWCSVPQSARPACRCLQSDGRTLLEKLLSVAVEVTVCAIDRRCILVHGQIMVCTTIDSLTHAKGDGCHADLQSSFVHLQRTVDIGRCGFCYNPKTRAAQHERAQTVPCTRMLALQAHITSQHSGLNISLTGCKLLVRASSHLWTGGNLRWAPSNC